MKKKLRGQKGVTLVEMLAAVAVLSLLGVMLQTGLQLALKSYHTMTAEAETQLLLSTVSDAIADELRYARDIRNENGAFKDYTSVSYGRRTALRVTDGQLIASPAGNDKRVISTGAYGNGVYSIEEMEITYVAPIFHIHVKVSEAGGISAETDFSVRCLNAEPETETKE